MGYFSQHEETMKSVIQSQVKRVSSNERPASELVTNDRPGLGRRQSSGWSPGPWWTAGGTHSGRSCSRSANIPYSNKKQPLVFSSFTHYHLLQEEANIHSKYCHGSPMKLIGLKLSRSFLYPNFWAPTGSQERLCLSVRQFN